MSSNDALAGRFRVERELGRGGMATVFLAQDLKQDRLVALKIIHPHVAAGLGPERFLREIKLTADDGALTRMPDVASGAHMSFSPSRSFILDVKGHKALWIFPVNGRPGQQIFAFPNPEIRIDYPTWSADGRWVLFDRAAPKGGDLWLSEASR